MVWIVDGRRVIIRRNHLVRLVGLMTCGVRQVGHVAKVILTVSEVHRTRAFGSGQTWQEFLEYERLTRGVKEAIIKQRSR